jgi:GNAT superfamily N-acetyltransferase
LDKTHLYLTGKKVNRATVIGWSKAESDQSIETILSAPIFSIVAEDATTKEVIGCGLVLGDNASFYYIKDIMVHPLWQKKQVGTSIMRALMDWLEKNAPDNSLVGLYTGENLAPFYHQFGFGHAFGMQRRIKRD